MTAAALVVDDQGVLTGALPGADGQDMADVVRRARRAGLRTAVLSNADRVRPGLAGLAGLVLVSGEVGLRKPDPALFALCAARLGVPPAACVLVDDSPANVRGAVAAGMVGVVHRDHDATVDELEVLLGVPLRD